MGAMSASVLQEALKAEQAAEAARGEEGQGTGARVHLGSTSRRASAYNAHNRSSKRNSVVVGHGLGELGQVPEFDESSSEDGGGGGGGALPRASSAGGQLQKQQQKLLARRNSSLSNELPASATEKKQR